MKKSTLKSVVVALMLCAGYAGHSQCTGGTNYLNVTLTNTYSTYQSISGCTYAGERNVLNVTNITATYSFNATGCTGNYISVYDASNVVVAHGPAPLINVNFPVAGTYYLQVNTSSSCGTDACCHSTFWKSEIQIPCSGTPSTGTVIASPTLVCPGTSASIFMNGASFGTGLQYLWYESTTSNVGPFVPVPTGTNPSFSTPTTLTNSAYYYVVMTCTNSAQTVTSAIVQVDVAGVTIDSVPYFESFEGITMTNQLPNCSWAASNLPNITQTNLMANTYNRIPHTGDKFASFRYGTNTNGDYFYSNGIYLEAGITYSAGLWYINDGLTGWSDISLLYGTTQSTTGLTPIASNTGALFYTTYRNLSDTFSVPSTGVYYLAVKAIGNSSPWYLSWDDLYVTLPCEFNSPVLVASPTSVSGCEGESVTINVSGTQAGSFGFVLGTDAAPFVITETDAQTGCSAAVTIPVTVHPLPAINIIPSDVDICAGENVNLVAIGATTYTWDDMTSNAIKSVKPNTTTLYTVIGENQFGCTAMASQQVSVMPSPNVQASPDRSPICIGESAALTASGAVTYQFLANTAFIQDNPALVAPVVSTNYTVVGTDENGCVGKALFTLVVDECTGISKVSAKTGINVYPNPGAGIFMIDLANAASVVTVIDGSGRLVFQKEFVSGTHELDLTMLANGIYNVNVRSGADQVSTRIVKQ